MILGFDAQYHAVYQITRYRLKAKLKAARPQNIKQNWRQRELFKKNLSSGSLNILQVDNGRFHTGNDLVVPENVILLFQPPYCPELNLIEGLWEHLKADLKRASFTTLDQLQSKADQLMPQLTPEVIAAITGYSFILDALSALNLI